MHYDRTRFLWLGISLVIVGFFFTIWQNLNFVDGGHKEIPVPAMFFIPTALIVIGFGIVAHNLWKQYKGLVKSFKNTKGPEV